MLFKHQIRSPLYLLLFVLLIFAGCKSQNEEELVGSEENEYLYSLMQQWYLWNNFLPQNIDPSVYNSADDLLDELMYDELDRWSYISDYDAYAEYYEEGTYVGYGFSYGWGIDETLRIRYVFEDSPFGRAGVQRGWQLLEIDNVNVAMISDFSGVFGENEIGVTQSFTFEDLQGSSQTMSLTKDLVTMNTVLHSETITIGTDEVGYLVFNSFIEPSIEELDAAFAEFEAAQINKLILDLRYNGGGRLSVAGYLADLIVQQEDEGKEFYKLVHNDLQQDSNSGYQLSKQSSLELDELIVLGTSSTASASELIINGLTPLMDVTLIATENTYGKPVGSYGWYSLDEQQIYSIISFYGYNSLEQGEYFDGIPPDYTGCDELTHSFGNSEESFLASAINYIETGDVSNCSIATKANKFLPELVQEQPDPILIMDLED